MLKDLWLLFLKLGIIGFGGPAAHIAMMQKEIVERKKWLTNDEFLQLIGITNLIPGPNSTEMSIFIGKTKGGWRGLLIAGISFILPAVILTLVIAVLYEKYGSLPSVYPFLAGIKPAIIAIIITAVLPLAKSSYRTLLLAIIGVVSFGLSLYGIHEIVIMAGAGGLMLALYQIRKTNGDSNNKSNKSNLEGRGFASIILLMPVSSFGSTILPATSLTLGKLFLTFLKVGAILYGSGYVLFAFLETDLVQTGLLTKAQLADAIAVGQMTPGPVFSSVTFIGYVLKGWQGALVSTVAVFIPSFLFIALLSGFFEKLSNSAPFRYFLNGVIASSVALIAAVGLTLGIDSITNWRTALVAVIAFTVSIAFRRINSAFIVVGGSLLGYFLYLI
jgi:chromate transporter